MQFPCCIPTLFVIPLDVSIVSFPLVNVFACLRKRLSRWWWYVKTLRPEILLAWKIEPQVPDGSQLKRFAPPRSCLAGLPASARCPTGSCPTEGPLLYAASNTLAFSSTSFHKNLSKLTFRPLAPKNENRSFSVDCFGAEARLSKNVGDRPKVPEISDPTSLL